MKHTFKSLAIVYQQDVIDRLQGWIQINSIHDETTIAKNKPYGEGVFKALQYMALEIPTVLSPVGVNATIVEHAKNGYLVENEKEWYDALEKLILEKELRKQLGKAGRTTIDNCYSVNSQKYKFLSLFLP
jgi:glycosyltransferase involved in cell wall biosynthesis